MAGDGKKHIHLFQTTAEHDAAYNGDQYVAPWVGYTVQTDMVSYNKYEPEKEYLTFEAIESGTFTVRLHGTDKEGTILTSLSYSLDNGDTWTTSTTVETLNREIYIELETTEISANDKVLFKGVGSSAHVSFTTSTEYNAYGNPMSLFYGDNFKNVTELWYGCFMGMFGGSPVVSAENVYLGFTTLANHCYSSMFGGCTSLTTAPELPATTLVSNCYNYMFYGCTSLTTAPVLPATTLADYCYYYMFGGCTSLTTAPELPATTLVSNCYNYMFYGCSNLNYIKAMFTTTPSTSYTENWVNGVATTGTFVKNSVAQWLATGTYGVPYEWTVETASA